VGLNWWNTPGVVTSIGTWVARTHGAIVGLLGALVVAAGPALADYDQGLTAFGNGEFDAAIEEFRTLAARGHPGAQFMLGVMYFNGSGVPQDNRVAAIFFFQAAQQGKAGAQLALGSIFIRGVGVFQDLVQAQTWLSLAAINSTGKLQIRAVALRDATKRLMTADQIAEAERLILDWRPTLAGLVRFEP
jgi:TPR repeat protein